jgi:hypothetical protein
VTKLREKVLEYSVEDGKRHQDGPEEVLRII